MEEGKHWNGKCCYAYGTSLTSATWGNFIPWLTQLSGLRIVNRGIPAEGITNLGGCSTGKVKDAICSQEDGKATADLILLEVGANDAGPVGDLFDTGDDTFSGCLNQCLRYLLENTDAQIVVIPSTIPTASPENKKYYYQLLLQAEAVCKINRVYFFGHADGLGQARICKNTRFVWDNVHQTPIGGYNRALAIWSQLKNVPLFWSELPDTVELPEGCPSIKTPKQEMKL